MDLSIVITTFNRKELLKKTLEFLTVQNNSNFEVVVIDDGSDQNILEVIKDFNNLNIRHHYYPKNKNEFRVSFLRNQGVNLSSGKFVTFLDCGMIVNHSFVQNTLDLMHEMPNSCLIHYIHGFKINFDSDHEEVSFLNKISIENIENFEGILKSKQKYEDLREYNFSIVKNNLDKLIAPWILGWSGSLTVCKEVFLSIGGFNEKFTSWGSEDTELTYRLSRLGNSKIRLTREAYAIHLPHPTTDTGSKNISNIQNRREIVPLKDKDSIILELYPYFDGQYFESFLHQLKHIDQSWYVSEYNEPTLKFCRKYIKDNDISSCCVWGNDSLNFLNEIGASSAFSLFFYQYNETSEKKINSLGIRTNYPENHFDLIIVTEFIGWIPEHIGMDVINEIKRISKKIIFLKDTSFIPLIFSQPDKFVMNYESISSQGTFYNEEDQIFMCDNHEVYLLNSMIS